MARLAELDEIDLEIEKLVTGGDGFARFEGIPVFVPRAAPGDRLRVRLTERRADFARAEIVEVLVPSDDRREAPCPHFADCGGCDLQHIEDARQPTLKAAAALETIRRLGRVEIDSSRVEVVAGDAWAYRLRTQVHTAVVPGTAASEPPRLEVGYFARGSHRLVPVRVCPVLVPELEQQVEDLPRRLPLDAPSRIDLAVGEGAEFSASPATSGLPHGEIELVVGPRRYRFDARCFFQSHRQLLSTLVDRAIGSDRGDTAFDLYCGVGLFSLPLADRYSTVTGVDSDRIAMRYARKNVRRASVDGVRLVARAVESWIDELPEAADRIVVDPPRSGLAARVRIALTERPAAKLTYVSCDAATLARDLGVLRTAYDVTSLVLFDLFPQTGHMEVVAQLERRGSSPGSTG